MADIRLRASIVATAPPVTARLTVIHTVALRATVPAVPAVICATLDVFMPGLSVVIGGRRYAAGGGAGLVYDTLRIERAVNARPTCRFLLTLSSVDLPARAPRETEDVVVTSDQRRLFGGSVYETTTTLIRGAAWTRVGVVAVGYAARLDERRIEGFVRTGENQVVADLVRQLIHDHADGEGFTTRQVQASDLVKGDVYDYIPLSEALTRLAEQSNSLWCVDPYRDLVFHARDAVTPSPITVDERRNRPEGRPPALAQRADGDREHARRRPTARGLHRR